MKVSIRNKTQPAANKRGGFTMIEMVIVISIIAMLSWLSAPHYRRALERVRASQAFYFLSHFQAAQERHYAMAGEYGDRLRDLDGLLNLPVDFEIKSFTSSQWEDNWRMVIQRHGASHGYGSYRIIWTQDGFDSYSSNIPEKLMPFGLTKESIKRAKVRNEAFR